MVSFAKEKTSQGRDQNTQVIKKLFMPLVVSHTAAEVKPRAFDHLKCHTIYVHEQKARPVHRLSASCCEQGVYGNVNLRT
jgi:hypothetical protein